jgi:hypothetical protein
LQRREGGQASQCGASLQTLLDELSDLRLSRRLLELVRFGDGDAQLV